MKYPLHEEYPMNNQYQEFFSQTCNRNYINRQEHHFAFAFFSAMSTEPNPIIVMEEIATKISGAEALGFAFRYVSIIFFVF